jgi:hypothetical protein
LVEQIFFIFPQLRFVLRTSHNRLAVWAICDLRWNRLNLYALILIDWRKYAASNLRN